jgi:hypothetical protein
MEMENKKLRDVAEIARQIMVGEELKGGQKKIDKNHNGKIDGQDFAILRGQKKPVAEAKYEDSKEDEKEDEKGEKETDMSDAEYEKSAKDKKEDKKGEKKMVKESIDSAAATILEYESKDGKFVHKARPGAYGGTKDEKHAVDTLSGPKDKELKAIESEKKKKKFSEDLDLYKEGGIKGLFEAWAKKKAMKEEQEQISEEPTSAEFDAQLADAKQRAAGTKKQSEVAKASVQAVQNEETHTTVEVIDFDPINGVQHSEIDLEERSMTEPEMKKREEIAKSMKKGMQGFKDRYGDRAKEVMYATATKQAMKD